VAWFLLAAGALVAVANWLEDFTEQRLLPGGHSPLYLLLGLAIMTSSLWWFGWFDRPK